MKIRFFAVASQLLHIGASHGDANSLFWDPTNLSRRYLPQMYGTATESIKDVLERQDRDIISNLHVVELTTDHWRDCFRKEHYTSMAVHFLYSWTPMNVELHFRCIKVLTGINTQRGYDWWQRHQNGSNVSRRFRQISYHAWTLQWSMEYRTVTRLWQMWMEQSNTFSEHQAGNSMCNTMEHNYLMYETEQLMLMLTQLHYCRIAKSNLQATVNVLKPFLQQPRPSQLKMSRLCTWRFQLMNNSSPDSKGIWAKILRMVQISRMEKVEVCQQSDMEAWPDKVPFILPHGDAEVELEHPDEEKNPCNWRLWRHFW